MRRVEGFFFLIPKIPKMAEQVNTADNDYESSDDECERKSFKDRLEDMPAYTMTLSNLQSLYVTVKGKNEYLQSAFDIGENVAGRFTSAAKPVVLAATDIALKVAKPVVGEIKDPAASFDECASDMLAKVQEKIPCVKQNPSEIVEGAKSSAKDAANYYLGKVHDLAVTQTAVKQLDNAVSFTDLIVELCFPTDGSNPDDMKELEQIEEDEDKGVLVHARNVQTKAYRRGTRKLMAYQKVQTAVHMVGSLVQYAQNRISETTGKLIQGSRYVASDFTNIVSQDDLSNGSALPLEETNTDGRNLISESWDAVYRTSMFIPKKALEVTGEVYISAKEMVFAYSNANKIKEMPNSVLKMAETYYNNVNQYGIVNDVKDKGVAFVYVPAQVISEYIQSNRVVQWIIPNNIKTETIQVMETVNGETMLTERASDECKETENVNDESKVMETVNDESTV